MVDPDNAQAEEAVEFGLPRLFVERLKHVVPDERWPAVIRSFASTKPTSFRINTLRGEREQILNELQQLDCPLSPINWYVDEQGHALAYFVPAECRQQLTHSEIIDSGKIYVQNRSSMLAPLICDPQPGETILDLAAAPGGKTTQLAQLMQNQGLLSAVEPIRKRMFKLKANLERCNVQIARTYQIDGRTVGNKTPERFDRVLLDAPCSSEARFRSGDPSSWSTWSLRKIRETSRKQIGLLKAAIHATKLGGTVVYCTCSFAPEENEGIVHKVLKKFGDAIEVVPITLPIENWTPGLPGFQSTEFHEQVKHCLRILPTDQADAFFLARMVKHGATT